MYRVSSITAAALTDKGQVRSKNEDAVWVDPDLDLIVVTDGLGGHASGEKASLLAVTTIPAAFRRLCRGAAPAADFIQPSPVTHCLRLCLSEANRAIFEAAQENMHDHGMGCTCTAVYFHGGRLSLAHVGDSRCYLIRNGHMRQITEDHSLISEQLKRGLITAAQAAAGNPNVLARALGTEPFVEIDVGEHSVVPGDIVLLCTDGLNKELSDPEILKIVDTGAEPGKLAERLVAEANAVRGRDNITVAVARVGKKAMDG